VARWPWNLHASKSHKGRRVIVVGYWQSDGRVQAQRIDIEQRD
jgi:hypothetical protein